MRFWTLNPGTTAVLALVLPGRPSAVQALEASQHGFDQFRERNCGWLAVVFPRLRFR